MTEPTRHAQVAVNCLKPHPANDRIYGEGSGVADADLVESVKTDGVITPLVVTTDQTVLSGHRRLDAAGKAGLTFVPVVFKDIADPNEQERFLVHANKQRVKTNAQIAREASTLLEIEAVLREKKRLANLKQGDAVPDRENFPYREKGQKSKATDAVGEEVGKSGKTVDKMVQTVKIIDRLKGIGRADDAKRVEAALDKSAEAGHKLAKQADKGPLPPEKSAPEKKPRAKGKPAGKPSTTPPPPPKPEPKKATPPQVDEFGIPVQPHAAAAFAELPRIDELVKSLKEAAKELSAVMSGPAGEHLKVGANWLKTGKGKDGKDEGRWTLSHLENAITFVEANKPAATDCPYAHNDGREHPEKCPVCRGKRWSGSVKKRSTVPAQLIKAMKAHHGVGEG